MRHNNPPAEAVGQPLRLVVLVAADLGEEEAEHCLGGEELGHGLGAAGDPAAEELQDAQLAAEVLAVLQDGAALLQQAHGRSTCSSASGNFTWRRHYGLLV